MEFYNYHIIAVNEYENKIKINWTDVKCAVLNRYKIDTQHGSYKYNCGSDSGVNYRYSFE